MKRSIKNCTFLLFFLSLLSISGISSATDTIDTSHIITDDDTVASANFELGFFNGGNPAKLYVGIWYKNIGVRTPIWVANRASPLRTRSGILKVTHSGELVVQDANNNTIWSSNTSSTALNPVAQLLDSGNLVIREANDDRPENYLWQSFDYPTNTFLQGMDFGWNLITGTERFLSSWTTSEDPAPGPFTFHLDITGYPQLIMKRENIVLSRHGPWNGLRFSGMPVGQNERIRAHLFLNGSVIYYREDHVDAVRRFTLSQGVGIYWIWGDRSLEWVPLYSWPTDICDTYGLCGAYGSCNTTNSSTPACRCLDGFVLRDEMRSAGCVRKTNLSLNCQEDVFLRYSGIKMPDSRFTWHNESLSLEECKNVCLRNCSCMAYSNLDIRYGGSGCLIWLEDLVDIRLLPGEDQEIYIRMAASELDSNGNKRKILTVTLTSLAGTLLLGLCLILCIQKWMKKRQNLRKEGRHEHSCDEDLELPTLDLLTLKEATNNFSTSNKLGEGGFGPVYEGKLEDGKEIAVKRLSRTSTQGLDEFKNEVICISKLQHRNLVKLLGCCIRGEEKLLIYEYMPNKSLDLFLFDQTKSKLLDWPRRFDIINGVARGLLYLHQDSRLRIIHRDLKASNILLDADMNPKISDFGMARSLDGNETEANTNRVVGTYGYMSPEYAGDGLFSVKSDVYSFGVLVLELVSGQRNRGFHHQDHHHNLLGHAWTLHKEGRSLELVDANLATSSYMSHILRSIHLALLCVQQSPQDRPSMWSAILMLGSEGFILPQPKQPGFFTERVVPGPNTTTITSPTYSLNGCSITQLDAR